MSLRVTTSEQARIESREALAEPHAVRKPMNGPR
jgi:hypothetical protein